jgi:tRNA A37 methylthiotransferase MiaB
MGKKKLKKIKVLTASGEKEVYLHGKIMSGYLVSHEEESMNLFHVTEDQILKK